MSPEEIKKIIESQNQKVIIYYIISLIVFLILSFLIEFFKSKGQNLATKQDIESITQKVEDVKAAVQNNQEVERQRRELKYNALLKTLKLIDAYISNRWLPTKDTPITKQYASAEEFRDCQNQLILTCENSELINLFYELTSAPNNSSIGSEMKLLDSYRKLVREELGFGKNTLSLDTNKVWFGSVNSEPINK